jgi:hypothetical protein
LEPIDADGRPKIDEALQEWRQGDCVLGEQWFVFRVAPESPLTDEAIDAAAEGAENAESGVFGFAIVTQSCDMRSSASPWWALGDGGGLVSCAEFGGVESPAAGSALALVMVAVHDGRSPINAHDDARPVRGGCKLHVERGHGTARSVEFLPWPGDAARAMALGFSNDSRGVERPRRLE